MKTGSTDHCLRDYLAKLSWGTKSSMEDRQEIMSFVGITEHTVRRWYTGETSPQGMCLIRTRYFLEKENYQVTELDALSQTVYDLGKLVAFNLINSDEVAKDLHFTETNQIFPFLHGNRTFSSERLSIVETYCSLYRDQLMKLNVAGRKTIVKKEGENVSVINNQTQITPVTSTLTTSISTETIALLKTLDGLVSLLTPRLETLLSSDTTPEGRQSFRSLAGSDLIFYLANRFYVLNGLLNALCSEKSREQLRKGK